MSIEENTLFEHRLTSLDRYFNRDLSWLSFNYRVLMEAADESVPLYERIKFLAIYSSNLDEFFRVRVAFTRRLMKLSPQEIAETFDFSPHAVMNEIKKVVQKQHREYRAIFREKILPALHKEKIVIYRLYTDVRKEHIAAIQYYFRTRVLAYLQPVIIKEEGKKAPFLHNKALYFAIRMRQKGDDTQKIVYAILNIPSEDLPRFLELPSLDGMKYYIFLDEIIRMNLPSIFASYEVLDSFSIKINRDAELNLEEGFSGDLLEKLKKQLDKRNVGEPTRFLYDNRMPINMLRDMMQLFGLQDEDLVSGGRFHNFSDLLKFPNPLAPKHQNDSQPALTHHELDSYDSFFDAIDQKDYMLHFPYQSYDYVLRFFNEAAIDPQVKDIKVTVYRIAANSFIANALISAARNGKKVTVLVEYKARFDEANNLKWADAMQKAGVKIIYSIPGYKVHAKIALVTRTTKEGKTKRYAYMGTGNFNEITARIYADHGLFTAHKEMTQEIEVVFKYLDEQSEKKTLQHLLVSQFNLRQRIYDMIDREIQNAQKGKKAEIIIKVNNLEDEGIIDKLYEASAAGVKVHLLIRSICCLIPQKEGLSENIDIIRVIDRYLEHARVFVFHNAGKRELYLASADLMQRNLNGRIEVGFPVYDASLADEVMKVIKMQMQDNTKACFIDQHQVNIRKAKIATNQKTVRAQYEVYKWLKGKA